MSTGSYDEASNLVKDPTSPLSLAEVDDVFDKLGEAEGGTAADTEDAHSKPIAASGKGPKVTSKHGIFKKPKSSKGLGFLIKAREGAKKSRSKSPLAGKSKAKKHKDLDDDDFLDELGTGGEGEGEVDENVKAKSEHWQMFQQMQERIKQNVLKTQSNIGKLASGHISPSGRISPAKDRDDDVNSSIRFANLNEQDSVNSDQGTDNSLNILGEEDSNNINNYYDSSDLANLISLPHFTVSSPSAFTTSSGADTSFSMEPDALQEVVGQQRASNTPPAALMEEFDLLGLSVNPVTAAPVSKVSQQSSLNEDLLGLDDFMSQPVSRDMSQENLTTDWLAGFSTAESSAQSSLCPSPVQFDVDMFVNQGKLVPESTAVSDLARSLVDDFLQWGAGNADEPLSKNPFQSDDFGSDHGLKPNAFNPFATIVESDDPDGGSDFMGGYSEITPSEKIGADKRTDPFFTDITPVSTQDVTSAFSSMDPFAPSPAFSAPLDINANAAVPISAAPIPAAPATTAPVPPARPTQHPHSRKTSRKSSNPFLLTDDDFAGGEIMFDDNFFASRGIFHAPSKDQDSIWGVSSTSESQVASSGTFSEPAANPFQDDLFTTGNFSPARNQAFGFGDETSKNQTFGVGDETSKNQTFGVGDETSENQTFGFGEEISKNQTFGFSDETSENQTFGFREEISKNQTFGFSDETSKNQTFGFGDEISKNQTFGFGEEISKNQTFGFGGMTARNQTLEFGEETSTLQPINPFLTASFENIASQTQSQPFSADNPFASMVADKSPALSPVHSGSQNVGIESLLDGGLDMSKGSKPSANIDLNFDPLARMPEKTEVLVESLVPGGDLFGSQGDNFGHFETKPAAKEEDEPTGGLKLTIKSLSQVEQKDSSGPIPMLPPPPPKAPKSPLMPQRENPFNRESPPEENFASFAEIEEELKKKAEAETAPVADKKEYVRSLTSEDSSPEEEGPLEPLEPFHLNQGKEFWKLMVRQPTKKKLAGNRFWKMTIVRLGTSKDGPVVRLFMEEKDTEPFQELPLQPCYSISDISMQQYDQFGKIHTVKIQYIFYRERVGIRPERITPSFVRKPKPNMILDHAPQVSELIKLGSLDIDEITSFVWAMEDTLMKLECHRDKTLTYTKDEVQAEVWDEYFAIIDKDGHVVSQKARVRIFFLAFLTGMPACELGISDRRRKGKEVVGRHDIIPVRTEDWIRIEDPEFHHVVDLDTYNKTHNIRFHPLDACQFELVRFRVRPKANRELPLQLRITQLMKGRHFEIRVDLLVTGYHAFSKKCGQFPCEDIEVRIKVPEVWIYYFRYEKRFGYGSLKAMARKPGRIKGLERISVMAQGLLTPALMEASVGSAKYEHLYRSVVWRIPRLPERNHGAYKNHLFVLHLALGQHDEIPDQLEQWADVSFTMPASTVSKAQVRSISVENPEPPEKWVRYIAKYQYKVEIDNQVETESDKDASD